MPPHPTFYFLNSLSLHADLETYYLVQVGLETSVLMLMPPKCWVFRHVPLCPLAIGLTVFENMSCLSHICVSGVENKHI